MSADQPLPVVAIIGRPNVGKSTLFNRLTRSRDALVHDLPGLTRDRQYGIGRVGVVPFIVVDTGGFEPDSKTGISSAMARQTRQAVVEADCVLFVVDARSGLTSHDRNIAGEMRRHAGKITLVVNKAEGMPSAQVAAEFHELGLGEPEPVSSAHGDGVNDLIEQVLAPWAPPEPAPSDEDDFSPATNENDSSSRHEAVAADSDEPRPVRIAVIGRPNAGKSTLINTLLGEERLVAFDQPGTTRDSVAVDFERGGRPYQLIDTAGVRRRARVSEAIEKFSVIKTLQAIEACNVCVLLLDATQGISDQDAHLAGHIVEAGRALVVAVNKWDASDPAARDWLKQEVDRKFHFLGYARYHYISALKGSGIGGVLRSVDQAYAAAIRNLSTPKLTRSLHQAVERQQPPRRSGVRPKLRYAHQGGQNPPVVVVHGSALNHVPASYLRYLEGWFRSEFDLQGTPLRVELRSGANPYVKSAGKRRR